MKRPLISRRLLLAGTSTALLPLRSSLAAGLARTPEQTEGPFYPVQFPADMDNDLVQVRGSATQALGTVLHLQGRLLDADGQAMDGAQIEIWQCDARGLYDHPNQRGRSGRDQAFQGYGRMVVDGEGRYSFRALKPVAYPGRTPHIHVKVASRDGRKLTTQFYIAGDPQNARDFVYRDALRDPRTRERVEMNLQPAPGLEPGALAASMDVVLG